MQCWGMLEHDLERERNHYLFLRVFCCGIIMRKGSKKGKKSKDFLPCLNICRTPTKGGFYFLSVNITVWQVFN